MFARMQIMRSWCYAYHHCVAGPFRQHKQSPQRTLV
jgi:hypothetical protein